MGRIYRAIDTVILILCLPFYVVAEPFLLFGRWRRQRRRLYVGLEVSHHPCLDIRQELRVVDLSRIDAGFVGIQSRTWTRGTVGTPPWSEPVEFVERAVFLDPPLDHFFGEEPA